jgi:putative ABC transport system ATP-binding protein
MILQAKKISKFYGETEILSEIDIEIEASTFFGISGASGCGKTTLLSILALLDRANSGQLLLKGRDITNLSREEASDIRNMEYGFIFQSYNMLMHLNVMENVILPFEYGVRMEKKRIEKIASFWLERVGMLGYRDKMIHTLSGGQQQRVAIARALVRNPDIIFADEPTGNLDDKNSLLVLDILKELAHDNHKSVIMVSHDREALEYCDRVFELDRDA